MALATSYATEKDLATFQASLIGQSMADTLAWTLGESDAGSYTPAVHAALRMAGVADVASATDMAALEAAARLAVWTLAAQHMAAFPRTATTEIGSDLESLYNHANEQRRQARIDAMRVGINYSITQTPIRPNDIYGPLEAVTT